MQKGNGVLFSFWWAIRTEVRGSTLLRHNSGICYLKKKKERKEKTYQERVSLHFSFLWNAATAFFFLSFISLLFFFCGCLRVCVCACFLLGGGKGMKGGKIL